MNLFDYIKEIFTPSQCKSVKNEDKFSTYEISYYVDNFLDFEFTKLRDFVNQIHTTENFNLSIKLNNSDPTELSDVTNFDRFEEDIITIRNTFEGENVKMSFSIDKQCNNYIYIYNFDSFSNFLERRSISNILTLIKKYRNESNILNFILLERDVEEFNSKGIYFSHKKVNANFSIKEKSISDNCHFANSKDYPFDASFFKLINLPSNSRNTIIPILNKLTLIFSIISIFDITSIEENHFHYKLNGYKTFEGILSFSDLNIKLSDLYFKIFDWIYCEKIHISDKLDLARNIISLSLKEGLIDITDSIYVSIMSGYKTYLQENISKYIELRSKIMDELSWISNKSGEIISGYLNNYQKSIFTFLSFFISVFILRFIKTAKTENVFTKEVAIFSLAFLLLSLLFMFFSLYNIKIEKKRLKKKYENMKTRYTDLLDENDIEKILKDDDEFNYELGYIKKQKTGYTLLWILTIIILSSVIIYLANWIN